MAQSGYTPILIYASGTATNLPLAANMTSSSSGAELALNYADGKLYYKNSSGVVTLLAQAGAASPVTTFTAGTTGFTPSSATSGAITLAGTLNIANGGTGQTTAAAAITALTGSQTSAYYLRSNGTNSVLAALSAADLTGTVAIASGGTGQTTATAAFNALSPITTAGDLILGNGTNSATRLAIGTNNYVLTSNGTTASWQAAAASGVSTFSAGTTGFTPSTATTGAVTLAGTLATTNGGTNLTSFTSGGAVYATSTSVLATGTLPNTAGGTGQSSAFTQYGITYASTTTALATTAAGTSTTVLHGNASGAPTFGAVSLTADVSGTLPVANGGTGLTTLTAGYIPYGNGTSALGNESNLSYDATNNRLGVVGTGYSPNITLSDAATVAWDTTLGQVATFTFVSSNRTMGAPSSLVSGAFYALAVIQNSGSNTLTWNSIFKWASGTAPTLSTAASAKDYFVFRTDGTNLYEQGRSQGVA